MGQQSMNGVVIRAEQFTWTKLILDEETIINCWTRIIDVDNGDKRVSNVELLEFKSYVLWDFLVT
jgi:hypothetical protein